MGAPVSSKCDPGAPASTTEFGCIDLALTAMAEDTPRGLGAGRRALRPPPRPDRGTPQGGEARPDAQVPPLLVRAHQLRLTPGRAPGALPERHDLRPLLGGRSVRPGAARSAAAPRRQDAAARALLHAGADRVLREAPFLRLPADFRHATTFRATYEARLCAAAFMSPPPRPAGAAPRPTTAARSSRPKRRPGITAKAVAIAATSGLQGRRTSPYSRIWV
jgi:hypothetical protein